MLLKSCFPAALLVAFVLFVLDASTPHVVGQVRTVTVTVYVTVTQQVYLTLERTVMVTVATGIPTTLTSVVTSVVTSAVTSILTQTSLVSSQITETSVVSSLVTQTVSVAAPIHLGPLSIDLNDIYGLRFLGYSGGVALAGFVGGILVQRARMVPNCPGGAHSASNDDEMAGSSAHDDGGKNDIAEAYTEIDKRTDAWQDQVTDAFESTDQGGTNINASESVESGARAPRKRRKPP